ncbi:Uncharacterised protein [Vibrio cholerae]|nr:Uncharacterised protein [Vibrio cholerae]
MFLFFWLAYLANPQYLLGTLVREMDRVWVDKKLA